MEARAKRSNGSGANVAHILFTTSDYHTGGGGSGGGTSAARGTRSLCGRLKVTVRRPQFNEDSLSWQGGEARLEARALREGLEARIRDQDQVCTSSRNPGTPPCGYTTWSLRVSSGARGTRGAHPRPGPGIASSLPSMKYREFPA